VERSDTHQLSGQQLPRSRIEASDIPLAAEFNGAQVMGFARAQPILHSVALPQDHSSMDDDDDDIRGEIVRLEAEIEQLAETIESARKLVLLAKLAMGVAALLIVVGLLGLVSLDPALLIGAFGVLIGGVVVFGSNASTLEQAKAATRAAELRRSGLIGRIDLRVVESPTIH
jgi:hypothetical protein